MENVWEFTRLNRIYELFRRYYSNTILIFHPFSPTIQGIDSENYSWPARPSGSQLAQRQPGIVSRVFHASEWERWWQDEDRVVTPDVAREVLFSLVEKHFKVTLWLRSPSDLVR